MRMGEGAENLYFTKKKKNGPRNRNTFPVRTALKNDVQTAERVVFGGRGGGGRSGAGEFIGNY